MGRGCLGNGIWQPTWKLCGVWFSVWLSWRASEENRSMSWMTKGGSSSALEQSPLHSPLNGLAQRGVAPTKHKARNATCSDYVDDGGWGARAASTRGAPPGRLMLPGSLLRGKAFTLRKD